MSKECLYCNVTFEPAKPKQKFCSSKCRTYFSRQQTKEGKSGLIEVQFDLDKLEVVKKEQNLVSPQAVLDYLMDGYFVLAGSKSGGIQVDHIQNPIHIPAGDPKEGSGAFFLKYGCSTYAELKELKNK